MNKKYVDYLKKLDIGALNKETARLCSDLRTTKLMTRLKHRFSYDTIDNTCENPFDVLYIDLVGRVFGRYYSFGQLAIIYIPREIRNQFFQSTDFVDRSITFTDFKKSGVGQWINRCNREHSQSIKLSNQTVLSIWDTPFVLEATTEYDKDFRKEWVNGCLEYEGNEYGDTSTFYIIGCVLDEKTS